MGVVVVGGVPGVGKSTVMAASRELGYTIANFGTAMFDTARKDGLVEDRDQMRTLPVAQQQRIQKLAAQELGRMEKVVVDTHLSILTPSGFMPGLPEWVVRALDPTHIVLVEADPDQIAGRRARDSTRQRDSDDIGLHQQMNRSFAAASATLTGTPVSIVINADGAVEAAAEAFVRILGD